MIYFRKCFLLALSMAIPLWESSTAYTFLSHEGHVSPQQSMAATFFTGYHFGQWVLEDDGYGEAGLFSLSLCDPYWIPFGDLRAFLDDNGRWAGSAGIGLRYYDEYNDTAWGVNLYYDYRNERVGNFKRIGIGVESLGSCWDFRFNGYLPVGGNQRFGSAIVFDDYEGPYKAIARPRGVAPGGISGEAGRDLYCSYSCGTFSWSLYGALGAYYFDSNKIDHIFGGYARANFAYGSYLSFEGKVSFDNEYDVRGQGSLFITIPFDCFTTCCQDCSCDCRLERLTRPVERQHLVGVKHDPCCWKWNW